MKEIEFQNMTKEGIIILDGAMGSNLMLMGMPKGVCTEAWLLDHPDIQEKLQRAYVDAGSDIIYAPTFQANRKVLKNQHLEHRIKELNTVPVQRAKAVAKDRALVAGNISSTGQYMESYETLLDVYKEQMTYLADAGVDLFAIETMIGTNETMAALDAAKSVSDLPVMCTMTVEADGSLLLGGSIYEAVGMYEAMGASAVGINCSLGPDQLEAIVHGIRKIVSIPVIVKPNAGIPYISDQGEAVYSMGPDEFAKHMMRLIEVGANIVGGCCGTNPEYISCLKRSL